jgi:hypothetical protein
MERAEFVASDGPSWWLYDAEIEIRIDEARRELGVALGTTEREWYNEANRRQELLDFLQTNGPQLLVDLDTLYNDEERLQWVRAVTKLVAPPTPPASAAGKDQPDPAAGPAPAAVQAGEKPAPAAAAVKKSIFKAKAASGAAEAAASDAGAAAGAGEAPGPAQLEDATRSVLSDVGGGGLADLARDLGVEPGDLEAIVNDPDFERQVRDEVARIVAG